MTIRSVSPRRVCVLEGLALVPGTGHGEECGEQGDVAPQPLPLRLAAGSEVVGRGATAVVLAVSTVDHRSMLAASGTSRQRAAVVRVWGSVRPVAPDQPPR